MKENKIDFVLSYVNPSDPQWIQAAEQARVFNSTASGEKTLRYRDDGLIELAVISIRKYCPWCRDIYLLLFDSEGQLPEGLKDKVKVIWHSEFIPSQYRPCFNSSCIEMFMPFLPESVSETFVYMNDDMVITRPLRESVFVNEKGWPRHDCWVVPADQEDQNLITVNAYNTILGVNQRSKRLRYKHGPLAYNKSQMRECWERYKKDITISPLRRAVTDTSRILYTFYSFLFYNAGMVPLKTKSFLSLGSYIMWDWRKLNEVDCVCMNTPSTGDSIEGWVKKLKEHIENEWVTIYNSSDV